jgi:hypothetical protein
MIKKIILITCLFSAFTAFSQKVVLMQHYHVIVSISAMGEESTVKAIKKLSADPSGGLSFLAYCNNQKCVILTASRDFYYDAGQVLNFLISTVGKNILGIKNYSLEDFYKICSFENESESNYFKTTYGK